MEKVDVVVIGAGFAGLGAAKTYMQCAPETNLLILDANPTVGGVWSVDRIYPTLRSNNHLGTLELPDYPMHAGFGVKPGEHIPGMVVHRYLCEYANVFGLTSRIRLNSTVLGAEKLDDGWLLQTRTVKTEQEATREYSIHCKKLIVATGLTSVPQRVHHPGEEDFGAPILNSAALASEGVKMIEDCKSGQRHMTVLGGSKSAYDAVYMFASKGFKVNWVIRKSGYGPTWMAPSHIKLGNIRLWVEKLPCTRILTWFSPCLWNTTDGDGWFSRFLHGGNSVGHFITKKFWQKLGNDVVHQTGLKGSPELQKLIPDESAMWYATSLAILNYQDDIHDYVKNGSVKIYREDLSHLSRQAVNLTDGTVLPSPGGLVTATNWQWAPNLDIKPVNLHSELGIPSAAYSDEQKEFWHGLDEDADGHIFGRFPMLTEAPQKNRSVSQISKPGPINEKAPRQKTAAVGPEKKDEPLEPFRLYRFLAPPGLTAQGDRSIVFQGYVANLLNQVRNEVTGLWTYAYLNDKLDIDEKSVCWHAALWNRFCKRRYSYGYGNRFPDFVFEQVPFFDQLLNDLGLPHRRKSNWFKEMFTPYGQSDYRGLTEEWLQCQAARHR